MATMRLNQAAALSALAVLSMASCVAGPVDSDLGEDVGTNTEIGLGHTHKMPVQDGFDASDAIQNASAPSGAKLVYYGGPVISNVKVIAIFWNNSVPSQSTITSFYQTITQSAYLEWLSEYNTQSQTIGKGSLVQSYVDTGAPSSTALTDTQVQTEITRLIN